jgi:hypothetical protein
VQWYDWVALLIIAASTIIQIVRGSKVGFGLPLFEAAGAVVAAVAATAFSRGLAGVISVHQGVILPVLFVVFAGIALIVARWLFALTGWSFKSYDGAYSILFGLVLGWAIAHVFLGSVVASQGANGVATQMAHAPVAREVYQFRTWNALMRLLTTAKHGPDFQ